MLSEKVKLMKDMSIGKIFLIEPQITQKVNIPCILAIPEKSHGNNLILTFNNETGKTLQESINNVISKLPEIVEGLCITSPILIPILPSKEEFNKTLKEDGIDLIVGDPKQFARECFDTLIPEQNLFYRLDEQVSILVKSAIKSPKINKVIGFGHSGSGSSILRFSLLHPELLDAVIIGGNGDIIPTPIGKNANELEYPFGIKEYSKLFGREFLEEDFRNINFQFYIGDKEDTNPVYDTIRDENYENGKTGNDFVPENLARIYKGKYGKSFFDRFKNTLKQYESAGMKVGLRVYKDDCHSVISSEDFKSVVYENKRFPSNCSEQIQNIIDNRLRLELR